MCIRDRRWSDGLGEPLSPVAVYSLGFLLIWACMSVAVALARAFPPPRIDAGDGSGAVA